jgi:hypothetical protein
MNACSANPTSAGKADKVTRGIRVVEAAPPGGSGDAEAIALASTLGYLDLRFEGAWRKDHPRLVAWLDGFAATAAAFEATRFRG